MFKSIYMGPGTGENVYDTQTVLRGTVPLNANINKARANVLFSLDKLKQNFPAVERINLEVGWFGNNLDPGQIKIMPKAEFSAPFPGDPWSVGNITRSSAELVTTNQKKQNNWGGTPSDRSIMNLVAELADHNKYKVMITPVLYIDLPKKPWPGYIALQSQDHLKKQEDLDNFFNQYEKFIKHYASLTYNGKALKDYITSFSIGSELKDLTRDPAFIERLIKLAGDVKDILGPNVKITYSANWAEYHSSEGGLRAIDTLWASDKISYVGINAFFPLTERMDQKDITYDNVLKGWTSGKDYDYYLDEDGKRADLEADWAMKNIKHWHQNYHEEAYAGELTPWVPAMKEIQFTRFGFICRDSTTDEPYICRNPKIDNTKTQAIALSATNAFLDQLASNYTRELETAEPGQEVFKTQIDVRYLNSWDARPEANLMLESVASHLHSSNLKHLTEEL